MSKIQCWQREFAPNSVYMQNVRNVRYANLTKNALDKNTVPATSMGFLSEQDTGLAKEVALKILAVSKYSGLQTT